MGSDQRFDYSVLGDCVNLAARLEGQSKTYGMNVVLGPTTYEAVKDELATIDLDFIQVKGKTEGTYIYGLLGDTDVLEKPEFRKIQGMIKEMMDTYRAMQFETAKRKVAEIRAYPKCWDLEADLQALCDIYDERIDEYMVNPPPADWDGVFVATSK